MNKYIHIITFLGHTVCRARFHFLVDGSDVEIQLESMYSMRQVFSDLDGEELRI